MLPGQKYVPLAPFAGSSGMRPSRILILGEAWGESEAELKVPFVGEAGKELWRMLGEAMPEVAPDLHSAASRLLNFGGAWISRRSPWLAAASMAMTNVIATKPPANKLDYISIEKKDRDSDYPPGLKPWLPKGLYPHPHLLPEFERLATEIQGFKPNLVLALGNTACWAMLAGAMNIGQIRGTVVWSERYQVKVLPTYHPAGVLRQWNWRTIVVADLMKAKIESQSPEISRPKRNILISPTFDEAHEWIAETERMIADGSCRFLAPDIETAKKAITCIGFARSRSEGIVFNFLDKSKPGWNAYERADDEREAWKLVERLLLLPVPKLFQNGMYDLQYILRMGLRATGLGEDTMLLHHSLFPEMQKGLGFLGSVYCQEPAWKLMRKRKADTEKRDE